MYTDTNYCRRVCQTRTVTVSEYLHYTFNYWGSNSRYFCYNHSFRARCRMPCFVLFSLLYDSVCVRRIATFIIVRALIATALMNLLLYFFHKRCVRILFIQGLDSSDPSIIEMSVRWRWDYTTDSFFLFVTGWSKVAVHWNAKQARTTSTHDIL